MLVFDLTVPTYKNERYCVVVVGDNLPTGCTCDAGVCIVIMCASTSLSVALYCIDITRWCDTIKKYFYKVSARLNE